MQKEAYGKRHGESKMLGCHHGIKTQEKGKNNCICTWKDVLTCHMEEKMPWDLLLGTHLEHVCIVPLRDFI